MHPLSIAAPTSPFSSSPSHLSEPFPHQTPLSSICHPLSNSFSMLPAYVWHDCSYSYYILGPKDFIVHNDCMYNHAQYDNWGCISRGVIVDLLDRTKTLWDEKDSMTRIDFWACSYRDHARVVGQASLPHGTSMPVVSAPSHPLWVHGGRKTWPITAH